MRLLLFRLLGIQHAAVCVGDGGGGEEPTFPDNETGASEWFFFF